MLPQQPIDTRRATDPFTEQKLGAAAILSRAGVPGPYRFGRLPVDTPGPSGKPAFMAMDKDGDIYIVALHTEYAAIVAMPDDAGGRIAIDHLNSYGGPDDQALHARIAAARMVRAQDAAVGPFWIAPAETGEFWVVDSVDQVWLVKGELGAKPVLTTTAPASVPGFVPGDACFCYTGVDDTPELKFSRRLPNVKVTHRDNAAELPIGTPLFVNKAEMPRGGTMRAWTMTDILEGAEPYYVAVKALAPLSHAEAKAAMRDAIAAHQEKAIVRFELDADLEEEADLAGDDTEAEYGLSH